MPDHASVMYHGYAGRCHECGTVVVNEGLGDGRPSIDVICGRCEKIARVTNTHSTTLFSRKPTEMQAHQKIVLRRYDMAFPVWWTPSLETRREATLAQFEWRETEEAMRRMEQDRKMLGMPPAKESS